MINGYAGGHTFVNGLCDCGRRLVDLRWITEADERQEGITHAGQATAYEIKAILSLVEQMDKQIETACGWDRPTAVA